MVEQSQLKSEINLKNVSIFQTSFLRVRRRPRLISLLFSLNFVLKVRIVPPPPIKFFQYVECKFIGYIIGGGFLPKVEGGNNP